MVGMVDFQERDTRRGLDDVLGREEDAEDKTGTEGSAVDTTEPSSEEEGATADHSTDTETTDLQVAILTISATQSLEDDPGGDAIAEAVEAEGHNVTTREFIRAEYDGIQKTVDVLTRREDVDVVITTGGTGVAPEDVTVEATKPLFEKQLPGFGELFRRHFEDELDSSTILNRTTAGIADGVPVICLPEHARLAKLGVLELLLPEAKQLVATAGETRSSGEE